MSRKLRHKVKPLPFLFFIAIFEVAAFLNGSLRRSLWYWAGYAAVFLVLWAWFASRAVLLHEKGIGLVAFWKLTWMFAPWERMEECAVFHPRPPPWLNPQTELGPFARWLWGLSGPGMRIIVSGDDPIVFFPEDLVDGWDLETALRERKIPFVR